MIRSADSQVRGRAVCYVPHRALCRSRGERHQYEIFVIIEFSSKKCQRFKDRCFT